MKTSCSEGSFYLTMIGLTIIVAVLILSCSADPRSPRIYNVLISSKKNLSPSHAEPVYEPVLRTTSIGYAFPSLFYHTSFVQNVPATYISPDYSDYRRTETSLVYQNTNQLQNRASLPISLHSQNSPISRESNIHAIPQTQQQYTQYESGQTSAEDIIPQYNPYAGNYVKYLPREVEKEMDNQNRFSAFSQEETDPKNVIANLRKNTNIPDVPPPPLPVKVSKKQ